MNRKEYEERIAKLEKELKELKEAEITNDEFPHYNNCTKHLEVDCVNTHQGSTLYFKSSEVLEELIARFGEEDIKKYYFGIEG